MTFNLSVLTWIPTLFFPENILRQNLGKLPLYQLNPFLVCKQCFLATVIFGLIYTLQLKVGPPLNWQKAPELSVYSANPETSPWINIKDINILMQLLINIEFTSIHAHNTGKNRHKSKNINFYS